ncbi:MAG: type II toxin-antitoxin system VapC family toxin [Akkermansiaceae bacterium]
MRILLDSHTALWWLSEPEVIRKETYKQLCNPVNEVFVSSVSIWELGLKVSRGKLKLPMHFADLLAAQGIEELSFSKQHALTSIELPALHGDPFDRALVAQCLEESLTFATRDGKAREYGIAILEV